MRLGLLGALLIVGGAYYDPHGVLGAHPIGGQLVIRTLRPDASSVTVVTGDEIHITHIRHTSRQRPSGWGR